MNSFLPLLYLTGKPFSAVTKNIFCVSAHTCPFRQLRWHLSQGKASHTLLQRRSAPRKVVRLLPVIRGRLTVCILSFLRKKLFTGSRRFNSLLPSFLSGEQNRNDDRRKKYNLTLSEESGSGYRKTHLNLATSAQILTAPVGRVWRLTHFCSVAPLPEKRFACFPSNGDGFYFAFSLYFQTHRGRFFVCGISLFFVFAILIFLFSGVKISVFFLKTDISFIFILLLYQLYCKPKNIFSWHYIFIPV